MFTKPPKLSDQNLGSSIKLPNNCRYLLVSGRHRVYRWYKKHYMVIKILHSITCQCDINYCQNDVIIL